MEGKDPTDAELKQLRQIGSKMVALNKEILKMGYDVYLSSHGWANFMKGPSHDDSHSCNELRENVVYSFILEKWDGGDW